ncbi:hypothetical protein [Paenibacillus sambharensis]|nr:hypothetical protein [Paenibacillus sambharensis]
MMWWKMAGWLGKAVASALIVSFLAIWTTGYIVNSYVEALIKDYNLPMKTQPFALSGVWGKLWGAGDAEDGTMTAEAEQEGDSGGKADRPQDSSTGSVRPENDDHAERDTQDNAGDNVPDSQAGTGSDDVPSSQTGTGGSDDPAANPFQDEGMDSEASTGAGSGSQAATDSERSGQLTDAGSGSSGQSGEETKTETGSGTGSQAQSAQGEAVITPEELARAKDQMSEEDRNKLFAMLVSKLPQSEWQTISTYVESGLTDEEMTNIQQIVAKHLDREEYEELMDILKKY